MLVFHFSHFKDFFFLGFGSSFFIGQCHWATRLLDMFFFLYFNITNLFGFWTFFFFSKTHLQLIWCMQWAAEVSPPTPSNSSLQMSSPKPGGSTVSFFLGGLFVLAILLIILLIFRKYFKPAEVRKMVSPSKRQQGTIRQTGQ